MRTALLFAGLLLATPAHAARHEVSFLFQGSFHQDGDNRLRSWFDAGSSPSMGLMGGYAVLQDRSRMGLVIDLGWTHHGAQAGSADVGYDQWGVLPSTNAANLDRSLDLEQFTVGAKADVDVGNVWYPYLHVQAGVLAGFATLSDPDGPDGSGVVQGSGAAPVGIFSAGFELMLPDRKLGWPLTAAIFFEGGYRVAGPLSLGALGGSMDASGPVVRAGFGLRM